MAPKLQTLPATASVADVCAALERDGACIVSRLVPESLVDTLLTESAPYLDSAAPGSNSFSGFQTQRIGALLSRTKAASDFVAHPLVLEACEQVLGPYCVRFQLHLTQLIKINPGQGAQYLHRDRLVWGSYLRGLEPELNMMWALTDFTKENGATRVVPGSQKWEDWDREAKEEEIAYAEMPKGSVLFYTGSVIHSGGKNESNMSRIGFNVDYSLAWLRQEENQFLSVPPEYAKNLRPEVQELISYTMTDYTCNYFSFPDPDKAPLLPKSANLTGTFTDALPAEYALGRPPRRIKKIAPNSLAGQNNASAAARPTVSAFAAFEAIEPEPGKEAKLVTLRPTASKAEIAAILARDGAVIVANAMSPKMVDQLLDECRPYLNRTSGGADSFSGFRTQRTGALVARSKTARDFVRHKSVLEACDSVLLKSCKKYQLHLTQLIAIGPGEKAQQLHRDRNVWGNWLSREMEPELNVIWAMTRFTRENGATRVVPGSNTWESYDRVPKPEEIGFAEMEKGSVLIYTGSVIHSGGANRSNEVRIGMNCDYSLGWLKQEENQYLSCPPEYAKDLPEDLQELIGYSQADFVLGYFSLPDPCKVPAEIRNAVSGLGSDTVPPEVALGRLPRKSPKLFATEGASGSSYAGSTTSASSAKL
ncbi:hypothetical protein DFJ74DRAFT_680380 [Hyaloraphidium curvatum]|nr:hypothetical protein DFJ74DRAFT_680380 [Hyaloraphidium curvatum]